jgi:hypothetical protein
MAEPLFVCSLLTGSKNEVPPATVPNANLTVIIG